jgi:hypothetical protein
MDTSTALFPFGWQLDLLDGAALCGAGGKPIGICTKPTTAGLGSGHWAQIRALAAVAPGSLAQNLRAMR